MKVKVINWLVYLSPIVIITIYFVFLIFGGQFIFLSGSTLPVTQKKLLLFTNRLGLTIGEDLTVESIVKSIPFPPNAATTLRECTILQRQIEIVKRLINPTNANISQSDFFYFLSALINRVENNNCAPIANWREVFSDRPITIGITEEDILAKRISTPDIVPWAPFESVDFLRNIKESEVEISYQLLAKRNSIPNKLARWIKSFCHLP